MNRMAIFVEGYTELVLVKRLIEEIAGDRVVIEQRRIRGGVTVRRKVITIEASKPITNEKYYVLIVECGGDALVKTRILEEYSSLATKGYSQIIGMRDIRGKFTYEEIAKLEKSLPLYVKTAPIAVQFVLAIMEIEAWFLAETDHYIKIDPAITVNAIKLTLNFDPENEDMQKRPTPSNDLDACYAIGGKNYEKRNAQDTIDALDYAKTCFQLCEKFPYLKLLIASIEAFLT